MSSFSISFSIIDCLFSAATLADITCEVVNGIQADLFDKSSTVFNSQQDDFCADVSCFHAFAKQLLVFEKHYGENAGNQHCHPFSLMFSTPSPTSSATFNLLSANSHMSAF